MPEDLIIRAFDGSLADAEGLRVVERATFDESPYSAEQVQAMLTGRTQRAWLAIGEGRVVGFVAAFPTNGLHGTCWEIDLLAVHPDWTGHGLATRLIQTAAAHGTTVARRARAVVSADNPASARAFAHAGFQRGDPCKLLIQRIKGLPSRPWTALGVTVRETTSLEEVLEWLPEGPALLLPDEPVTHPKSPGHPDLTFLLAKHNGQPAGCAAVIEVQTLLYRGMWIESLAASGQTVQAALAHAAVKWAITAGLDEIGMMVPQRDRPLQETLLAAGFRSLGDFDWVTAPLPLPDLASSPAGEVEVGQTGRSYD